MRCTEWHEESTMETTERPFAAAIVVLVLQVVEAPRASLVAGGVVAFLAVWGTLFPLSGTPCTRSATRRRSSPLRRR